MGKLVRSKRRVTDYGEVLTPAWLVKAMLDLVKAETERIDSRFLEPACGNGNFLTEILERKMRVVKSRYGRLQLDFERYAVLAVSSIYGIDILEDNVKECRQRLLAIVDNQYSALFPETKKQKFREAVQFILKRNIIWGDALTLKTVGDNPAHIVFSEWSLVNGSRIKRRDFTFYELLGNEHDKQMPLFSDLAEEVYLPMPVKEYPPVHFLEIAYAYGD